MSQLSAELETLVKLYREASATIEKIENHEFGTDEDIQRG